MNTVWAQEIILFRLQLFKKRFLTLIMYKQL